MNGAKQALFTVLAVGTLWTDSSRSEEPMLPPPVATKHEALEVKDTAEISKILLETVGRVPRIQRAAVFVAEVAEGFRVAKAAGRVTGFASKSLAKIAPAGPFVLGWFSSNAALDVVKERSNMKNAGLAVDESIGKLRYLLALHSNGEVKFGNKTFKADELITMLKEMREDLTKPEGTNWAVLKEAGRALIPWLHNETAEEANGSARALLILEQAIRETTATLALQVEERLKKQYADEGERTVETFVQGLSCNLYISCITGTDEKTSMVDPANYRTVNLPMSCSIRPDDKDARFKKLKLVHDVLSLASPARSNFGCTNDRDSNKVYRGNKVTSAMYQIPGAQFPSSAPQMDLQIMQTCKDVPGWNGNVWLRGSTYASNGFENMPPTWDEKALRQWQFDLTKFYFAMFQSNPDNAAMMARNQVRLALPLGASHGYEPPKMVAR